METTEKSLFPSPESGNEDGVVGYTGNLNCDMLIDAYLHGIFPWPCDEKTVLWCSPKTRGILPLDQVHVGKRLCRELKKSPFRFRVNTAFDRVIEACAAAPRPEQDGTWITSKIINAYKQFHRLGYAHSFEAFTPEEELAGGMYGVSIGKIFCGESMFFRKSGASKFVFVHAVELLRQHGVVLLDTQMVTSATAAFGAHEIPISEYLNLLKQYRGSPIRFD